MNTNYNDSKEAKMRTIKSFLKEAKNVHMTHLEEALIVNGPEAAEGSLKACEKAFEKLINIKDIEINVKVDGAPALYAGWFLDPDTQERVFICALKALFAKSPKIIYDKTDIEKYYGDRPDLADKVSTAWEVLSADPSFIPSDQIWQGDIMFTESSLQKQTIEGQTYLTFHPNTILYAVKEDSEMGSIISNSKLGVIWHTRYKGSTLDNMNATYDISDKDLKPVKNVWAISSKRVVSSEDVLSQELQIEYQDLKVQAVTSINKIKKYQNDYEVLLTGKVIPVQINAYINSLIKEGIDPSKEDANTIGEDFLNYLSNKSASKISRLHQQNKKSRPAEREYEKWMESIEKVGTSSFIEMMKWMFVTFKVLWSMKHILLEGYNNLANYGGDMQTFLVNASAGKPQLEKTGHEGFVIEVGDYAYKLVDRLIFAAANFGEKYAKGWQH